MKGANINGLPRSDGIYECHPLALPHGRGKQFLCGVLPTYYDSLLPGFLSFNESGLAPNLDLNLRTRVVPFLHQLHSTIRIYTHDASARYTGGGELATWLPGPSLLLGAILRYMGATLSCKLCVISLPADPRHRAYYLAKQRGCRFCLASRNPSESLDLVKRLIKAGCDVNHRDISYYRDQRQIERSLLETVLRLQYGRAYSPYIYHPSRFRIRLNAERTVVEPTSQWHVLSKHELLELVRILVEAGAVVEDRLLKNQVAWEKWDILEELGKGDLDFVKEAREKEQKQSEAVSPSDASRVTKVPIYKPNAPGQMNWEEEEFQSVADPGRSSEFVPEIIKMRRFSFSWSDWVSEGL